METEIDNRSDNTGNGAVFGQVPMMAVN